MSEAKSARPWQALLWDLEGQLSHDTLQWVYDQLDQSRNPTTELNVWLDNLISRDRIKKDPRLVEHLPLTEGPDIIDHLLQAQGV